jgi:predicted dehydrogenase
MLPVKVGLLGTGFGIVHAGLYHGRSDTDVVVVFGRTPVKLQMFAEQFGVATTTDIDSVFADPEIDLIDVCLPTPVHADVVVRALEAGKDVFCELPLASSVAEAERIIEAEQASGRRVFVDMFGRFDPGNEYLLDAIRLGGYGPLETLQIELRSARLWEGYPLRLDSIALDMMHSGLDTITRAMGMPSSITVIAIEREDAGSAAEALLTYPGGFAQHSASSLMPPPYEIKGGYRAVFRGGVLESTWTAGFSGSGRTTLTEYTNEHAREIDLPASQGQAAVLDHIITCRENSTSSRISPASVLDTLRLTLDIHEALVASRRP